MKVVCEREPLLSAFQTAAMVAPSRSPKQVLQHVKLEVHESSGVVMATDLEVGIRVVVDGLKVESPGSVLLPVTRFGSLLRESTDDTLHLDATPQGVHVQGQRSEYKLPSPNPDEFPNVAPFAEEQYHQLPARLFRELIRRSIFATDTESSRYALGGVLLELESDRMVAVGTDGRRLAKMEGPAEPIGGHQTGDAMTIVPSRSMQLIERALVDGDAMVQVAARANDVLIRTPKSTIYSRLVEGRFPKWRDVFPKRSEAVRIDLAVGPLYSAVRQAAIVADEESRGIDFHFGEGRLVLAGTTADVGTSRVELPIAYDGAAVTVTLNHRFVADFCRVLDSEKMISVEIEGDEGAAVFQTDDGYGYVVMPLARDHD